MFKAVFIDIDNTLLDFDKCAVKSMYEAANEVGLALPDGMPEIFKRINDGLWVDIERGALTREELRLIRWNRVFAAAGVGYDGVAFEKLFSDRLYFSCEKLPFADETLDHLSRRYKLYAASNGMQNQQRTRLGRAGLLDYFDGVFTSELIGAPKPDKRFFDGCMARIGDIKREEVIVVGDSPTADVKGAKDNGFAVCWCDLRPGAARLPDGLVPDFTVTRLDQLKNIL